MLKAELITLVLALRAENSLLTTQLAAARCHAVREPTTSFAAIKRLAARYPDRKSFTADEVRGEVACSV